MILHHPTEGINKMSVLRTYRCNLCGGSDEDQLMGIYWTSTKAFSGFIRKGTREVEHHLCYGCIKAAAKLECEIPRKQP